MANRFVFPTEQWFDGNGVPSAGWKLEFLKPGTSTNKDTFQDRDLTTANTNPVVADANGVWPNIFLDGTYDVRLLDDNDVQRKTWDDVRGPNFAAVGTAAEYDIEEIQAMANEGVYETTSDGLAATTDTEYFWVPDGGDLVLYQNDGGSAVETTTFPDLMTVNTIRDDAEDARDAVLMTGDTYETTSEGIADTTDGDYFTVPEGGVLTLYRNDSGGATKILEYAISVGTAADSVPTNADLPNSSSVGTGNNQIPLSSDVMLRDPEHATDGGTDAYASATNTSVPGDGVQIVRDFQSANTTTTPTLDGNTITDRDGNALWANAISGVHSLQYDSGADTYLLLYPIPDIPPSTDLLDEDDMASDSDTAVPTQQSVKAYADAIARDSSIQIVRSTNLIWNSAFREGYAYWGSQNTFPDGYFVIDVDRDQPSGGSHQVKPTARLLCLSGTDVAELYTTRFAPIDKDKSYRYGCLSISNSTDSATLLVQPLTDGAFTDGSELSASISQANSSDAQFASIVVNADGGASPSWGSDTAGAIFGAHRNGTADWRVYALYFIAEEQLPMSSSAAAFEGTHEARHDGANDRLWVITHDGDELARMTASTLIRENAVSVSAYPHDLILEGGFVWVISTDGQSLSKVDPDTVTVTNSWTITGPRKGFALISDGTTIWMGAGDPGAGETPAIIAFDISAETQSVLTTDVNGQGANLPVADLNGSLWSVDNPSSGTADADIKRINKSTGATEATISGGIGLIYGLASDGSHLYASGLKGIAKVDPSTDTVVATYLLQTQWNANCLPKFEGSNLWGTTNNGGVWMLNTVDEELYEQDVDLPRPKWVEPVGSGKVITGCFDTPSLVTARKP